MAAKFFFRVVCSNLFEEYERAVEWRKVNLTTAAYVVLCRGRLWGKSDGSWRITLATISVTLSLNSVSSACEESITD